MPLKKASRTKSTAASKKSSTSKARSKKSKTPSWSVGAGTILLAVMCVTGAVIVIAAHELTPAPRAASIETDSELAAAAEPAKAAPSSPATTPDSEMAKTSESDMPETKGTVGRTGPVTVFGCLERSDSTLRLTDTDGVDAPKARSWKTAFLKKGAASIEVVDPGNHLRLSSHVGQRLSVTGTLSDRQMQVRSIRRISATCD